MMNDLPADHMPDGVVAPPPTDSLDTKLIWLSERYLRNSGDREFVNMLGEILRRSMRSIVRRPL